MKIELIIVICAVVLALACIICRKQLAIFLQKPETMAEIKKYILVIEKNITGKGQGGYRLELVCEKLKDYIPAPLRMFVTAEMLTDAINFVFQQIAVRLDDGTRVPIE